MDSDRRAHKRFSVSLPIMLPTGKVYTKNISAGGVYFELETGIDDLYSIGQNIPIWIYASYNSATNFPQQLWLFGNAVVVRKELSETQPDKWGVGLKFIGKLDSELCTVSGFY